MTAVSWFKEELKKHKLLITPFTKGVNSLFEQAKEMEKEQITNAFIDGEHQQGFEGEAEQYYNETYKNK